jgi:hypothetical protein
MRDLDLERKFRVLLASPLSDGLARIIEDAYRMLPMAYKEHEDELEHGAPAGSWPFRRS